MLLLSDTTAATEMEGPVNPPPTPGSLHIGHETELNEAAHLFPGKYWKQTQVDSIYIFFLCNGVSLSRLRTEPKYKYLSHRVVAFLTQRPVILGGH